MKEGGVILFLVDRRRSVIAKSGHRCRVGVYIPTPLTAPRAKSFECDVFCHKVTFFVTLSGYGGWTLHKVLSFPGDICQDVREHLTFGAKLYNF